MTDDKQPETKRKPGRPQGGPGFGGRPATRPLLPESKRKKRQTIYCSDETLARVKAQIAVWDGAGKTHP